jgi:hypothetical protein
MKGMGKGTVCGQLLILNWEVSGWFLAQLVGLLWGVSAVQWKAYRHGFETEVVVILKARATLQRVNLRLVALLRLLILLQLLY